MRRRCFVGAVLGLALAVDGCAASGRPTSSRSASVQARRQISLALTGGGATVRISACRMRGLYRTYALGGFVAYHGRVTPPPSGRWTVKVKLKRCLPHGFSETFFEHVRGQQDGRYSGIVPRLNPNEYYVRADFEGSGSTVRSPLAFFRTAGRG